MITDKQLKEALLKEGYREDLIFISYHSYTTPTEKWCKDKLGNAFSNWLFSTNLQYELGTFDCRNYSLQVMALAKASWALTKNKVESEQYRDWETDRKSVV